MPCRSHYRRARGLDAARAPAGAETSSIAAPGGARAAAGDTIEGGASGPRQAWGAGLAPPVIQLRPRHLAWLERAARLPGRSLHAALAALVNGLQHGSLEAGLSNTTCAAFGLDRNAKYRALAWLEGAKLVAVDRKLGRSPTVTILEVGGDP